MNLCVYCGNAPRKISASGQELTLCSECQKEYWRGRKRVKRLPHPGSDEPRICIDCGEPKPLSEFAKNGAGYRHRCKPCWSAYVNQARKEKKHDDGRGPGRGKAIVLPGSKPLPAGEYPVPRPVRQAVVIVDRANNRFLMCEPISETPIINELTVSHVIKFYQTLGYRVVDGLEEIPTAAEAAGD